MARPIDRVNPVQSHGPHGPVVESDELVIPTLLGGAGCATVSCGIILFFVAVAIFNLAMYHTTPGWGITLSIIWLAIVALGISAGCLGNGLARQFVIESAEWFSRRRFAVIERYELGSAVICLAYELFGRRITTLRARAAGITSVTWSTGQASHMAGRDVDDWSVMMWFDQDSALTPRPRQYGMKRSDCKIIGPPQRREDADELGGAFVELLARAGVALEERSAEETHHAVCFAIPGRTEYPDGLVRRPLAVRSKARKPKTARDFLPESKEDRAVIGVLALPLLLVATGFLIGMPIYFASTPPQDIWETLARVMFLELLVAIVLFLLLAMIWAISAPAWISGLLESRARYLVGLTGVFLVLTGAACGVAAIMHGIWFVVVMMGLCFCIGLRMIYVATRSNTFGDGNRAG